jgi:nucleoside-diphosphate-sugar epimerase
MRLPDFTVLGCQGTIGRALTTALQGEGFVVQAVDRTNLPGLLSSDRSCGHVVSCIGLTGDFRRRPLDTVEAHVGMTARCVAALRCESFLYLSSTRVYARADDTSEDAALGCQPTDASDLYNLSKLTGEVLCLADPRPRLRVVRLSNVYSAEPGAATFLGEIVAAGRATWRVLFRQGPDSEKDYVSLADVVRLLPAIAIKGRHRLYNMAAGHNTRHAEIAAALATARGWQTAFVDDAPTIHFAPIAIDRIREEFGAPSGILLADLAMLTGGPGVATSGEPG